MRKLLLASFLLISTLMAIAASAQNSTQNSSSGMNMPQSGGEDSMRDMPGMNNASADAIHSMEGHHMEMGPHMRMTELRPLQPGDKEKAAQIAEAGRAAAERYKDYRAALADGFKIFLPNVPQHQYHFTNYRNALYARDHFDPSRPTSLLYQKQGEGYKLIGVMYTAKKGASEDDLNSRIPLSIAQWHAHVNFCAPPRNRGDNAIVHDSRFGFSGSIATKGACDAAGGKLYSQVFGWMVHLYPFEKTQAEIWSVERQHGHMD